MTCVQARRKTGFPSEAQGLDFVLVSIHVAGLY